MAPTKASRPSSSSDSTSTSTPARRSISFTACLRFFASRIAAVATVRIASAPSSCARRTCVATTSPTSAIFAEDMVPSRFVSAPICV